MIHDFQGGTVFAFCLLILFAETWVLVRIGKNSGRLRYEYLGVPSGSIGAGKVALRNPGKAILVLSFLFLIFQLSGVIQNRAQDIPNNIPLATFPMDMSGWHGEDAPFDSALINALKPTDYISADYQKLGETASISLYIAYYARQAVGISIHSPANCIPGSGWKITSNEVIGVPTGSQSIPVSRMFIEKDGGRLLVYYWFSQRGRIINNQYQAKFYLFVDSIIKNRTDGALVRLITPIESGETIESADKRMQRFLLAAYSQIKKHVPE